MTILIILALIALCVVYAVFFLLCKAGWLIFKSHSNKGPCITAGVLTVLVAAAVTIGTWLGVQAIVAPFAGMKERIAQNPARVYGQRVYQDQNFSLTVFDGMDFSEWINLGALQLKLGVDTNALKKDAQGKAPEEFLITVLARQAQVASAQKTLEDLQEQLQVAQSQRRLTVFSQEHTQINGLPAYEVTGEGYSNRGKLNFWLTALQADPHTLYYVGSLALRDTPQLQEQAIAMAHSFELAPSQN